MNLCKHIYSKVKMALRKVKLLHEPFSNTKYFYAQSHRNQHVLNISRMNLPDLKFSSFTYAQ